MKRNEYVDYLLELMQPFGIATARPMFGGFGVFKEGRIFAIIVSDVLYFKTDDVNRHRFETIGLGPFTYIANEKVMTMSYHRAPDDALENPHVMSEWARDAFEAALRTGVKKKPNPKRKKVRAKSTDGEGGKDGAKPPKRPKRVKPTVPA